MSTRNPCQVLARPPHMTDTETILWEALDIMQRTLAEVVQAGCLNPNAVSESLLGTGDVQMPTEAMQTAHDAVGRAFTITDQRG